jgi:diadenosine tetraphosphate (Ap4A) HIT family hydrolase
MTSTDGRWQSLIAGVDCPLCAPRPADTGGWTRVARLGCSTLYLDRNQTYRGHCQLVFDPRHVVGLENLTAEEYGGFLADARRAALAIVEVCRPDLMNYACLGNVMPHVHMHLVPRYRTDPRWGAPIYTSNLADMPVTRLTEAEYRDLAGFIRGALGDGA